MKGYQPLWLWDIYMTAGLYTSWNWLNTLQVNLLLILLLFFMPPLKQHWLTMAGPSLLRFSINKRNSCRNHMQQLFSLQFFLLLTLPLFLNSFPLQSISLPKSLFLVIIPIVATSNNLPIFPLHSYVTQAQVIKHHHHHQPSFINKVFFIDKRNKCVIVFNECILLVIIIQDKTVEKY